MSDRDTLHELKELASKLTVLYVEDNAGLREQAERLFKKFFHEVITATNGEEGLEKFKEHRMKLVITDIRMPKMDGLKMARRILQIAPQTKIMLTSAYDETSYLLEAINIGIFRYLKKPLVISELTSVLLDGLKQIEHEEEDRIFNFYVQNIFEHQQNLLILFHDREPVIANKAFLDFFEVEDLVAFQASYKTLGENFLPHHGFLYNHESVEWFDEAVSNSDHLHHVKMRDREEQPHHFIFKMLPIEGSMARYLVSLDDITELGLLPLFDDKSTKRDKMVQGRSAMIRLLESLKRNNVEVKMHNLYKGLTITNSGLIGDLSEQKIEIRSSYLQQKGAQLEGRLILSSELFPADILCESVKNINFEKQTIEVDQLRFIDESPTRRTSIRLEPEPEHTASLFYHGHKFGTEVSVIDISLEALKMKLFSLPAGLKRGEEVRIDIVLTLSKRPFIINTEGKVYDIRSQRHEYHVVIMMVLSEELRKGLIEYLSNRQMSLIREFKGMQYAK